ncbi:amidohydrolase family protein [Sediminicoccus sp. KRV36]|uniref:amidohydrolase family protein n=1 Tax=Sediminicoccus sp. KRV36 TaxID=3133721 RepID=UPI00200E3851|nr:amidohydrolase family protein [Sediminicoccus rosea]UPY37982.1 amidohydrolase family protein [Sediminicoccus rosea]
MVSMIPPPSMTASRHIAIREAWLAQHAEAILEPDLPIIDPHHHIWDHADQRYLLPEFLADAGTGHDIRASVFIQCSSQYDMTEPPERRPLGETRFMTRVAEAAETATTRACAGIVGLVDLTLGDRVVPLLEEHVAIAGGRFRGVRNRTAWDAAPNIRSNLESPPPGPLPLPAFREGARRLAAMGLTLDVWAYHPQLAQVLAVARAVPEVTLIVNHCGGPIGLSPYRRADVFAAWRASVTALAGCPNVMMKLGGLAMDVGGYAFHQQPMPPSSIILAEAWRPAIETCIEAFGAERCMFESNFPVDKGMCSYPVLWNAFKRLATAASASERTALFSGTAARVYRLSV